MNGQINSGAAVPFFTDRKYQTRYYADDGHSIIASSIYLVPFMFWVDDAPDTVAKFYLVNVASGAITDLDETMINRVRLSDDSKAWYYFTGEDLQVNVECGFYYIVVELSMGEKYYSDVINVQVFGVAETHEITVDSVGVTEMTLNAVHVLNTTLSRARVYYQVNGLGAWTEATTNITGATVDWDMPIPIPDFGSWYRVRYVYKTAIRNWAERYFTLKFDVGDPAGTVQLEYLKDNDIAHRELFEITISNTTDHNNYLYSLEGVNQKIYLPGSFGFPEPANEFEVQENGDGEESLVSSKTRLFQALTLLYIPDQFLQVFADIKSFDSITVTDLNNGKVYDASISPSFALDTQEDGYYSRGVLRFQSDYIQRGACGENVGAVAV